MSKKFKNKYRSASARAQWWDYGWDGAYFITICTDNRTHFFGKIENQEPCLSDIGILAEAFWLEIPNHFSFVTLGEFIIMPNHLHGILVIDKTSNPVGVTQCTVGTTHCVVPTVHCVTPTDPNKTPGELRFRNQGKNTVSSIIGSFKSVVSKYAHFIDPNFKWQSRFYDSIIRSETAFDKISAYIRDNPKKWKEDDNMIVDAEDFE